MSGYTPTTEEIRDYIRAADRVTAHMFGDAVDSVEAFDRWLATHDAEARAIAEEPEWEGVTGRGFGFTEILVADYEGQPPRPFTVQQSSLATECKVWIGSGDTRAHMNIEEASRVRDALNAFLAAAWVPVEQEGDES